MLGSKTRKKRSGRYIAHFEKYHNILKTFVCVVLHVNLTFALSFVHDLHVQCGSLG